MGQWQNSPAVGQAILLRTKRRTQLRLLRSPYHYNWLQTTELPKRHSIQQSVTFPRRPLLGVLWQAIRRNAYCYLLFLRPSKQHVTNTEHTQMPKLLITYVLLNGPKYSGKTTMAATLCQQLRLHYSNIHQDSFAAPMKHFIATALSAKYSEIKKDVPVAELSGYSVREFLIDLSEQYMKVRYGEDIFGRLFHYRCLRINPLPRFVISDDCGFDVERDALPRSVTVRIERPGHDFSGDSRNYLSNPDYTIVNDGTLNDLQTKMSQLAAILVQNH